MAAPVVLVLKTGDPVVEGRFTCQSAFGKQLQRAIHGGEADPRVLFGHQPVKFVGGKMFARFEEGAQDRVPLLGVLQTHLLEMTVQDLLGLAHALARDHRLVVNTFLQHPGADLQRQDTIAGRDFENEYHFQFDRIVVVSLSALFPCPAPPTIVVPMAAPNLAVSHPRPTRKIVFYVLVFAGFVLLGLFALVFWFYHAGHAALPQVDGRIQVSGVTAPVTVTRDSHGVPTIDAATLEDLFFAQGYVTAQDRLWQMDMTRRFAGGEMAEVLGPSWIKHDREQRILLLRARSERGVEELLPQQRSHLDAYSRGVNALIDQHRDRLPLEFRVLRYSPQPWTPADCLVIAANMDKEL